MRRDMREALHSSRWRSKARSPLFFIDHHENRIGLCQDGSGSSRGDRGTSECGNDDTHEHTPTRQGPPGLRAGGRRNVRYLRVRNPGRIADGQGPLIAGTTQRVILSSDTGLCIDRPFGTSISAKGQIRDVAMRNSRRLGDPRSAEVPELFVDYAESRLRFSNLRGMQPRQIG
jgi:hypothetical protein